MLAGSIFFIVLGVIISVFLVWRESRSLHYPEESVFDLFFLVSLSTLTVSRLLFVILHFDLFGLHVIRWIAITIFPGLSFVGGIIGCLAGLAYWSKKYKLPFRHMADICGLSLISGTAVILLGIGLTRMFFTADGMVYQTLPMVERVGHPITIVLYIAVICALSIFSGLLSRKYTTVQGHMAIVMSGVLIVGLVGIDFLKEGRVYYTYITAEQLLLAALFFGGMPILPGTKISLKSKRSA